MKYCFKPIRIAKIKNTDNNIDKDVENLQPSDTNVRILKWILPLGKTVWKFLKMLNLDLYNPVILILDKYSREKNISPFKNLN